jgi:hypothetical protein
LADHFKVPAQTISKAISPYGIRAQETKRGGIGGRYFTQVMKEQIEDIYLKYNVVVSILGRVYNIDFKNLIFLG